MERPQTLLQVFLHRFPLNSTFPCHFAVLTWQGTVLVLVGGLDLKWLVICMIIIREDTSIIM